jgi:two-component system, OmpR family, phosphate regulon sensor histidine kinase PhoR
MPDSLTIALIIAVAVLVYRLRTIRDNLAGQIKAARKLRDKTNNKLEQVLTDNQVSLDAISDAFFIVNSELEISRFNTRARETFRDQDLIGRSLPEIILHPTVSELIQSLITSAKPAQERLILPSSSHSLGGKPSEGETAWIIQLTPLPNLDRAPLFCIVLRDVSTEHRADQIRTDFVANASHELRTPLAIINGYLENLVDDDILEDPAISRRMLTTMRKHGNRLSRLVDDMLVVSRLESGENTALNREPFDLIECANDVIERLDQLISSSGAELVSHFPTEQTLLNGDRFYWTQVMFNLLENAIKQNQNRDLKLTFSISKLSDNRLQIVISDNGIGIPSSHLPFIFKRFYRVDKHHTQSDIKGTGLGLSIVKRAVEAHDGTIEATSQPGIKTSFTITVPSA